jgi:hypothetical protein
MLVRFDRNETYQVHRRLFGSELVLCGFFHINCFIGYATGITLLRFDDKITCSWAFVRIRTQSLLRLCSLFHLNCFTGCANSTILLRFDDFADANLLFDDRTPYFLYIG